MKQKDILLIAVIALFSAVLSFFISDRIFVTPTNRQQKVEVVDVLNSQFKIPDKKYFNDKSVNPTQLVTIGNQNNQNPFSGTGQ